MRIASGAGFFSNNEDCFQKGGVMKLKFPNRKRIRFYSIFTIILLLLFLSFSSAPYARCTFLIAGKEATEDGSILIARNEDLEGGWAKHIVINPVTEYKEGETITSKNDFVWELPEKTLKYISVQDCLPTYGIYHECAINSEQVAVSATTTARQNEKSKVADPLVEDGVGENIITTLIAQKARTALEGVQMVGQMVETKGASESFGMAIGDPKEVWLLEVGGGHHWVAVKVPDDTYFVGANALRIGEVNLTDHENFCGSADLIDFAIEHQLYDPDCGEPFHFAKAYGTAKDYQVRNYRRVWGGLNYFTPSAQFGSESKHYPLFNKPDEKIGLEDAMNFMRYHYQDTEYDSILVNPNERGIGTFSTIESHVLQLRDWLPNNLGGVQWIALSTPLASPFIPYYVGIEELPAPYRMGSDQYDDQSAYWAFRTLAILSASNFEGKGQEILEKWHSFEKQQLSIQPYLEETVQQLLENNEHEIGIDLLNQYTNGQCLMALHKAYQLKKDYFTQMSNE
jgi:dipeptidase